MVTLEGRAHLHSGSHNLNTPIFSVPKFVKQNVCKFEVISKSANPPL